MKLFSLLFILLFPIILLAQAKAPLKWKDISMEELSMTEYNEDPQAPAVILYDFGQQYYDINQGGRYLFLFIERIVRIKILNEEGLKYAKIKILFHDLHCEKFYKENNILISARAYNLKNGKEIVSSKLKQKNIIYKDTTNCMRIAEFTIPGVKVGSVIEYKYKIPTLDMIYPQTWYFQSSIPTKHSEFRFFVPNDFQYTFSSQNIRAFDIQDSFYYSKILVINNPQIYTTDNVDLSGQMYRFVLKNVAAFSCKNFINNPKDYMPKLNIHLLRIMQRNQSQIWKKISYPIMITTNDFYYTKTPEQRRMLPYPSGYIILTSDWAGINDKMLKHHRFGMPLTLPWKDKGTLDSISKRKKSDKEKMLDIYNFLRKEIKWDSSYTIYATRVFDPFIGRLYTKVSKKFINEKSLRKPFEEKTGSNVEINFIMIHFLKRMGLEAEPVLISTKENGMIDTNMHTVEQFNHVIVRTKINGEYIFLDVTDSLRPYNFLRKNSINRLGFVISKKKYEWVNVNNKDITQNKIVANLELDKDFNVKGKITNTISGYDALDIWRNLSRKNQNKFENIFIQTALSDTKVSNITFAEENDINKPLIIKAEAKISPKSKNQIELKPLILLNFSGEDFYDNFRICPVELDYPFEYNYTIKIKYPEGFQITYPQDINIKMFSDLVQFKYSVQESDNQLVLHIDYSFKQSRFPKESYLMFARFIDKINAKLNEKIIIKKN